MPSRAFFLLFGSLISHDGFGQSADEGDVRSQHVINLLEFGGTTASALYTAYKVDALLHTPGDRYETLARKVASQVYAGQAASKLAQAPFDLTASTLTTLALVDQEPVTRSAAAISAYASKRFGETVGNAILTSAKENASQVLSRGLAESSYAPQDLQNMSREEYLAAIADLKIGGQKMSEILADDPGSLARIQEHAEEFHRTQTVATLLGVKQIEGDVIQIKSQVQKVSTEVKRFATETAARLDQVQQSMDQLQGYAIQHAKDLQELRSAVKDNSVAIQTLAQVSSMNWSAEQKLAALNAGLFNDLSASQVEKMRTALQSQIKTEQIMVTLRQTSEAFGSLATIGNNLGIDPKFVKAAQAGQILATSVAQFAAGGPMGYLSGAASLSALAGLGGGGNDAMAGMKRYLEQEFRVINQKLTKIIELQEVTLDALYGVSLQLAEMQKQLNHIEYMASINTISLTQLLDDQWLPCQSLIGSANHLQDVVSTDDLLTPLRTSTGRRNLQECYRAFQQVFESYVSRAAWGGGRFGLQEFPSRGNGASLAPGEFKPYSATAKKHADAYATSRNFILDKYYSDGVGELGSAPAYFLAGILDVKETARGLTEKLTRLAIKRDSLNQYRCGDIEVLSASIGVPLCAGTNPGSKPQADRIPEVFNASLAGPQALRVIGVGIPVVTWADFAIEPPHGTDLEFVAANEVQDAPSKGLSDNMKLALAQRLGDRLLNWLDWLNTGYLLQYATAYGDFTANAIVDSLYDESSNAFKHAPLLSNASDSERSAFRQRQNALLALEKNPLLARNVVLLGIRKALTKNGVLQISAYTHGFSGFDGAGGCRGDAAAIGYLRDVLPNWNIVLEVSESQKQNNATLADCLVLQKDSEMLSGPGLAFEGLFISVPRPEQLKNGTLEQPPSLRLGLRQKAKLAEMRVLRGARKLFGHPENLDEALAARELMASQCLTGTCMFPSETTEVQRLYDPVTLLSVPRNRIKKSQR